MSHVAAFLLVLALASPALAHDRSVSYSDWEIRGAEARVRVRVSALDASFLANEAAPGEGAGAYFERALELRAGAERCLPEDEPSALAARTGELAFEWRLRCAGRAELAVTSRILAATVPGHLHFARVRREGGPFEEHLLTTDAPTWTLDDARETSEHRAPLALGDAVRLGVSHVASGLDHLAFLAALLLGAAGVAQVLAIVTAFTLAHSLTLALATLGSIVPEPASIEALIGLSIALVAAENLSSLPVTAADRWIAARLVGATLGVLALAAVLGLGHVPALTLLGLAIFAPATILLVAHGRHRGSLRAAVAFLFGLVHGFGFANVLTEARLEGKALAVALFGFNVGVELGQIAVVTLFAAALALAARAGHATTTRTAGSTALLAAGVAWFVVRAYG